MEKRKLLCYKYGSCAIIILNLILFSFCPFIKVSEVLATYFSWADGLSGIISGIIPGSFQDLVHVLNEGQLTIWDFQNLHSIMLNLDFYESSNTFTILTPVWYWILIAFMLSAILEVIFHFLNKPLNGLHFAVDVILTIVVLAYFFLTMELFEDIASSPIRFTFWGITCLILPFVATVLWEKYTLGLKKLGNDTLEDIHIPVNVDIDSVKKQIPKFINETDIKDVSLDVDLFVETKKIDAKLKEIKNRRDELYLALGSELLNMNHDNNPALKESQDKIIELIIRNEEIQTQLNRMSGYCTCPVCSTKNDIANSYCLQCGNKL